MANGHGGKRPGAGRPRKSLADQQLEGLYGKRRPKVLNLPDLEDISIPEPPDYLRQFNASSISNHIPSMERIFRETTDWLSKTKCLHLINPDFITHYALLITRWLECEDIVSRAPLVKSGNKDPVANPLISSAMQYKKAADAAWDKIWSIVAQNSEMYYGDDPSQDIMAQLLNNKPK